MGAGPSRSVSFRNPEPAPKIIQITEEVAQRMTNRYGKQPSANEPVAEKKPDPVPKPVEPRPPTVTDIVNPNPPPPSAVAQSTAPSGLLTVGHKGVPIIETITAYEVRQQKDNELRENDKFWGSKLKELEARYVASAFVADAAFKKEVDKLDKLVPKPKEPVCQDISAKVAQCYSENAKQPLRCSEVVKEFAVCVDNHTVKGQVPMGA